jgi:hypothetical protein
MAYDCQTRVNVLDSAGDVEVPNLSLRRGALERLAGFVATGAALFSAQNHGLAAELRAGDFKSPACAQGARVRAASGHAFV